MNILPLRIYLEQPVLVASSAGDPNSVASLDYLPGSLLRGLLIGRYLHWRGIDPHNNDLASDPEARRLFFDGGVRYLNAYLFSDSQMRSLPKPLALLQAKTADTDQSFLAYNAAHQEWDAQKRREIEHETEDQLKPLGGAYCTVSEQDVRFVPVQPHRITVHVQRDRSLGRSTEQKGAVFQYEALAEGQWFASLLLIDQPDDLALLQQLLRNKQAWIGRSRSAHYGQVRIEVGKPDSLPWRENGAAELYAIDAGEPLGITLLSDVLLRDPCGVPVASLAHQPLVADRADRIDDRILSAYLGFEVHIDPARSFSEATLASGFNQTWRLPLPQQPALKAGSHFTVYPRSAVSVEQLQRLEQHGIGERRAEGFGRIAFQWLENDAYTVYKQDAFHPTPSNAKELSAAGRTAAQRMALRLLEQRIELEIANYVRKNTPEANHLPRNSQLGRLRVLLRHARQHGDTDVITKELDQFKAVARDQFANARLGGRSLRTWIEQILEPDAVWGELNFRHDRWPQIAGIRAEHTSELTTHTTLRLIDALLTGLHRTQRQKEEEQSA